MHLNPRNFKLACPPKSFDAFSRMCSAMGVPVDRERLQVTTVDGIRLGVGWADCSFATDTEVAGVA